MRTLYPEQIVAGCSFQRVGSEYSTVYRVMLSYGVAPHLVHIGYLEIQEENGTEFYRVITADGVPLVHRDTDRSLVSACFRLRNLKPATTYLLRGVA